MLVPILVSLSYFFACFGVTIVSEKKIVKPQNIFHIAVIFTPLTALLIVVLSKRKKAVQSKIIVCKNCGYKIERKEGANPESDNKRILIIEEPHYS